MGAGKFHLCPNLVPKSRCQSCSISRQKTLGKGRGPAPLCCLRWIVSRIARPPPRLSVAELTDPSVKSSSPLQGAATVIPVGGGPNLFLSYSFSEHVGQLHGSCSIDNVGSYTFYKQCPHLTEARHMSV